MFFRRFECLAETAINTIFRNVNKMGIYLELLHCSISDELGCHGIHCFIDFKSCWLFSLPFLPHQIRKSNNKQPFKSETKITKLLWI